MEPQHDWNRDDGRRRMISRCPDCDQVVDVLLRTHWAHRQRPEIKLDPDWAHECPARRKQLQEAS